MVPPCHLPSCPGRTLRTPPGAASWLDLSPTALAVLWGWQVPAVTSFATIFSGVSLPCTAIPKPSRGTFLGAFSFFFRLVFCPFGLAADVPSACAGVPPCRPPPPAPRSKRCDLVTPQTPRPPIPSPAKALPCSGINSGGCSVCVCVPPPTKGKPGGISPDLGRGCPGQGTPGVLVVRGFDY